MNTQLLIRAIARVRPGAPVSIPQTDAATLADVVWHNETTVPATQQEVDAAVAAIDAENQVVAEIDQAIGAQTIGTVQPAAREQLTAMTRAQYNAWFDVNFDTTARLIGLLKSLTLIIIRRVL
ncbi:MAG: hypothetical protein ACT4PS_04450 [Betaproteobacteria bacterium]